ncbi:MAG: hypothetical protein Q6K90_03250 [Gloeomargarita sp. HHBFW_bins_162]
MTQPPPNFWQKAKAKIQDMTTSPQAEQVKKLAQNAVQKIGETAQDLQHQTEALLTSERVHHLRQDVSQTAQNVTQQVGTALEQVTKTIQTTTTDLVGQAKKHWGSEKKHEPTNDNPSKES